jgi:oxaloacetate decarboxylase gamma subunit
MVESGMTGIGSALIDAGNLMLIGMVTVFAFLTVLVVVVHLLSKFAPALEEPKPSISKVGHGPINSAVSAPVVAAISAAIHQYKQNSNS